jgi:Family of unknown function (DUF5677)
VNGIAELGLLSPELDDIRALVRHRYKRELSVVEEINKRAVKLQYELQIPKESAKELLTALLYVRTLHYIQSAMLMVERGLDLPARVLLRVTLEALFNLGAVAKDSAFLKRYIDADRAERLRLARKLVKLKGPPIHEQVAKVVTPQWIAAATFAKDEVQARKISVEEVARVAGMEDLYNSAYARFSYPVHSTAWDLEQHLELDGQGNVENIKVEPSIEGLQLLYVSAGELLLEAVDITAHIFGISIEQFCLDAKSKLKELISGNAG